MIKNRVDYLTSSEVGLITGFTPDYIRYLIRQKKLTAEKIGRNWIVARKELKKLQRQRFSKEKE